MSNHQGERNELLLLAAVAWEFPSGSERSKVKVYRNYVISGVVKGSDLVELIGQEVPEVAPPEGELLMDVYDSDKSAYVSLFDLLTEDMIQRFGTRLRMTVQVKPPATESDPLAIMGRFYSYDDQEGITIAGKQLRVQEIANQENAGTGVNVWDGALLLAQYLENQPQLVQNKRVLELGAGCGLVGMAAGVLGAAQVLLTDLPYALPNMKANVENHAHHYSNNARMVCHALDWYDPPTFQELGGIMSMEKEEEWVPEVILVADCVWMQELVEPLLKTLERLTPKEKDTGLATKVLVSYQRRGKLTHEEFWAGLHTRFPTTKVTEIDITSVGLSKPDVLYLLCLEFGGSSN